VLGKVTRLGPPADGATLAERLDQLRLDLARRFMAAAPDTPSGALAVAFSVGIRGFLPADDIEAMRVAGLTHLLSISGTHMAMVAGLAYLVFRRALLLIRLSPGGTGKPVAAVAALLAAFGYLLISGMSIPTIRSFITVAVGMVAILAHRQPFSLWTVAIAALMILAARPGALTDPGFQLSFTAVISLIVFYQRVKPTPPEWSWRRRILRYFWLLCLSSVVVTLATSPISAWHFHRFPPYGTLGNLVAIPAMGVLVMPPLIAALVALPFGMEGLFLHLAAPGLWLILWVSEQITRWPSADLAVPVFPGWAAVLLMLGVVMAAFLRRRWRWSGLVPAAAAAGLILITPHPDIVISPDGRQVGLLLPDRLLVAVWRSNGFIIKEWQEMYGYDTVEVLRLDRPALLPAKAHNGVADAGVACDGLGCRVVMPTAAGNHPPLSQGQATGTTVWLPLRWQGLKEAGCPADAALVIAPFYLPRRCGQLLRLSRDEIDRNGAHALYLSPMLRIVTDRQMRGTPPWGWNLKSDEAGEEEEGK
jgi:competence protein ComEC